MRSILDGERGDGVAERVERWALKRMSSFLQIETLWRFNAKYEPSWIPRYIVYDSAEHLVPAVLAILRAESLWEVPVIGKMLGAAERRIHGEHEDPSAAIKVSAPAPSSAPELCDPRRFRLLPLGNIRSVERCSNFL